MKIFLENGVASVEMDVVEYHGIIHAINHNSEIKKEVYPFVRELLRKMNLIDESGFISKSGIELIKGMFCSSEYQYQHNYVYEFSSPSAYNSIEFSIPSMDVIIDENMCCYEMDYKSLFKHIKDNYKSIAKFIENNPKMKDFSGLFYASCKGLKETTLFLLDNMKSIETFGWVKDENKSGWKNYLRYATSGSGDRISQIFDEYANELKIIQNYDGLGA